MKSKQLLLRVIVALVVPALACTPTLPTTPPVDILPPTATLEPTAAPTPTPEGGGVAPDFFSLDLSTSDQEGLEQRANEIYQAITGSGGDVGRDGLLGAYEE